MVTFGILVVIAVSLVPFATAKDIACKIPQDTPLPDFSAPGRRISNQKCHEYNWQWKHLKSCSGGLDNFAYPYMGAIGVYRAWEGLEFGYSFYCGALLVSPKFVLTSGLCATAQALPDLVNFTVKFGNANIKKDVPRREYKVIRTTRHPDYNPELRNDMAVMELEEPVSLSKSIFPACLWTQDTLNDIEFANSPVWGNEKQGGKVKHDLVDMEMPLLKCDSITDEKHLNRYAKFQELLICADESAPPVKICTGASGSPMMSEEKQDPGIQLPYAIAVSSSGLGCGAIGYYTKVSSFIDWIEGIVWPNS